MNDGNEMILNEGQTEVWEHMARFEHKGKVEIKFIKREESWYKRGIVEALEVEKRKPMLNKDKGRYNVPAVYLNLLHCGNERESNEELTGKPSVTEQALKK